MLPDGVAEVGYKAANDHEDEWLMSEEQAGPGDHLLFRFVDDEHIRLYAERANLELARANAPEASPNPRGTA